MFTRQSSRCAAAATVNYCIFNQSITEVQESERELIFVSMDREQFLFIFTECSRTHSKNMLWPWRPRRTLEFIGISFAFARRQILSISCVVCRTQCWHKWQNGNYVFEQFKLWSTSFSHFLCCGGQTNDTVFRCFCRVIRTILWKV